MTRRYFAATDGKITVFRASNTITYASATISSSTHPDGRHVADAAPTFSRRPVSPGNFAAREITRSEYDTMTARRNARMLAQNRSIDNPRPYDSWVSNKALFA